MSTTYGIGGTEVRQDANEAFQEIPQNRTLMVEQLTADPPVKPEFVEGLKTVEEVFQHFAPTIDVDFEDAEGSTKQETLSFRHLGDFGPKGITQQSQFFAGALYRKRAVPESDQATQDQQSTARRALRPGSQAGPA